MNVPIMRLFGVIVVLFAILVAWTSRWSVFEAQALRDNSLDKRPLFAALRVKRGARPPAPRPPGRDSTRIRPDRTPAAASTDPRGATPDAAVPSGQVDVSPVPASMVCWVSDARRVTSIFRGLARSATGIITVRTPFS